MTLARKEESVVSGRKSEIRQKSVPDRMDIVPDFKHLSPKLKAEAKAELLKARNTLVETFSNDKGQLSLFKDEPEKFEEVIEEEDEKIPADRAQEIIDMAKKSMLDAKDIGFVIEDGVVKIIRVDKKSNARAEIADYPK